MKSTRVFTYSLILFCLAFSLAAPLPALVLAQEEGPILPQSASDSQVEQVPTNALSDLSTTPPYLEVIGAGNNHSCGIKRDGTLACWGDNSQNQATPPAGTFSQVSAGEYHNCGIKTNGTLACWGDNSQNQSTPPTGTFSQVSAGYWHSCGVKADGTVACWGDNSQNQATPPAGTFSQVSAGHYHTCGVKTDGTLACWGDNSQTQSTPPAGTFSQVDAGKYHNCGIKTDGTLDCWGWNGSGQATPPADTFSQVSVGYMHSCGVKTGGALACWGDNSSGQSTPPGGTFNQASAGYLHNCGIKTDGTLACWGKNDDGQTTSPAGAFGPSPIAPGTYRPSGDTYTSKPTYSWKRIPNVTSYRLIVYSVSPSVIVVDQALSSSYCSTTTDRCSYTSPTALTNTNSYQWKVRATNLWGSGSYSTLRSFTALPGFNSTFNGSYPNWIKHPGGTWATTSSIFYTNGAAAKYSSASYYGTFGNFTYSARIKQPSTNASSFSGLIVRGKATFNTNNSWKDGLFFVTNKDGKYKVYKTISGTTTTLKNWTSSAAIVKNGWNILKVTADGYNYKFSINGTLVWSGSDSSRASGRAGLISLSFSSSTAEKFYADWATLTMSDYYNKIVLAKDNMEEPTLDLEDPPADPEAQP